MAEASKVGILGSGDVARRLGAGFAARGYDVMLGSREPKKLAAWTKETKGKVAAGTFAQAARHGQVLVLAVHGDAAESVLDSVGAPSFAGKLVLDATNPLDFSRGMPPGLFVGTTDSLGERVQRKLPAAKVVKCFNTVGNQQMVDPKFASGPPRLWICGNDADAKRATEAILKEFGWGGAFDVGGIDGARWLEAMVPLWFRAGVALNTWEHVLQVVR